jgi:hypothetical protein
LHNPKDKNLTSQNNQMMKTNNILLKSFSLLVAVFLCCSSCKTNPGNTAGQPEQTVMTRPDFCGIWGIWGGENVSAEGHPWFKGVVTTTDWKSIEPQNGVFSWDAFDKKVQSITSKGLKVMLMVYHGNACPDWIYDEVGVPVVRITGNHPSDSKPYPYFLDPRYRPYLERMIRETAKHIAAYPPELKKMIVGVQCPTGKSGDPQPYHAGTLDNEKYAIDVQSPEWRQWTIDMIKVYQDAYKDFKPPFFMLFKGPNPSTNEWLIKNIPDSWRKPNAIAQGYQFNGEIKNMNELYPQTSRFVDGVVLRTRGELDNTQYGRTNWFNSAPVWNVYWSGLWNLTYGLDLWSHLPGVLEDERHVPAFTFFSEYAGYKTAVECPGAWIALRDGLDYMDTLRFPENRFGSVEPIEAGGTGGNRERYRLIAEYHADCGAKMEDLQNAANHDLKVRSQKGINDVYSNIWPGNYGMYLEQIDPNETSIGYWRVGSIEEPYGRFARALDPAKGKEAMFFNLSDDFFEDNQGPHPVSVRVVYFDQGTSSWSLFYDAMNDPHKEAVSVTNKNTNQWKEITVDINDAKLSNRGEKGSDFNLMHTGGSGSIFHMIEIKRKL